MKSILKRLVILPALGLAAFAGLAADAQADLVINEARIDQSGTDNDEYFELYADGMSFADLSNHWYLVIGDTSTPDDQFGRVENATQLSGSLTAGDWLLVGEATMTIGTPDIVETLSFENSDNVTHLLVTGFTGAVGDDLDTDNDGALDLTPWTTVVDGFSLIETVGSGDGAYAAGLGLTDIGPDGTFVPGHVFRAVDGTAGAWQIGEFADTSLDTAGFSNVAIPEPGAAFVGFFAALGIIARRRRA